MAKKRRTKSDKIIAQLRRQLDQSQPRSEQDTPVPTSAPRPSHTKQPEAFSYSEVVQKKKNVTHEKTRIELPYDTKLIRKDLRKTLILSTLAFSLELVLYFYLNSLS